MPRTTAGDYGDLVGWVRGGVNDAIRFIEGKMRVPGYEGIEHMHDDAIGAREEVFPRHDWSCGCVARGTEAGDVLSQIWALLNRRLGRQYIYAMSIAELKTPQPNRRPDSARIHT